MGMRYPVHTNAPDIIGQTFTIANEQYCVEEITRAPEGPGYTVWAYDIHLWERATGDLVARCMQFRSDAQAIQELAKRVRGKQ